MSQPTPNQDGKKKSAQDMLAEHGLSPIRTTPHQNGRKIKEFPLVMTEEQKNPHAIRDMWGSSASGRRVERRPLNGRCNGLIREWKKKEREQQQQQQQHQRQQAAVEPMFAELPVVVANPGQPTIYVCCKCVHAAKNEWVPPLCANCLEPICESCHVF